MLFLEWDRDKCIGHIDLSPTNQGMVYIDHFWVDPSYSRQGIGHKLAVRSLLALSQAGYKKAFGVIAHDEFHDKSAMNALKMGMYAQATPYTYVTGDISDMVKLMEEGYNGR